MKLTVEKKTVCWQQGKYHPSENLHELTEIQKENHRGENLHERSQIGNKTSLSGQELN